MTKRFFDLIASGAGIIFLSPLLIIITLLIVIDSRGPVFFRQARVGRREKIFYIHKFRTMVVDAESLGGQLTLRTDTRVTKAGKLLRKYKLDELPQLFDVICGSMSLVGPRPEVPRYVAYYPIEIRKIIYSVRPGITDLASIEYKDENNILDAAADYEYIYVNKIIPEKTKYYLDYVNKQSLILDFKIIIKTINVIFKNA